MQHPHTQGTVWYENGLKNSVWKKDYTIVESLCQELNAVRLNKIKVFTNYGYDSVHCFTLILCRESHHNDTLHQSVHEALRQLITLHYNYIVLSGDAVSKYIPKVVTSVMALFLKQHSCLSNKATTGNAKVCYPLSSMSMLAIFPTFFFSFLIPHSNYKHTAIHTTQQNHQNHVGNSCSHCSKS